MRLNARIYIVRKRGDVCRFSFHSVGNCLFESANLSENNFTGTKLCVCVLFQSNVNECRLFSFTRWSLSFSMFVCPFCWNFFLSVHIYLSRLWYSRLWMTPINFTCLSCHSFSKWIHIVFTRAVHLNGPEQSFFLMSHWKKF